MTYDIIAAIEVAAPGVVVQRANIEAVTAAYIAGGQVPLTSAQIIALVGPLPIEDTGMPRIYYSNPAPGDDGSSIPNNGTTVRG